MEFQRFRFSIIFLSLVNVHGSLVKLGDNVVFTASTVEDGWAIYRTDGTESGTEQIALLPITFPSIFSPGLRLLGDKVLFQYSESNGRTMGLTDGTAEGTQFFDADIATLHSAQLLRNGRLIAINGEQIVVTDGTSDGTVVWLTAIP